MQSASRGEEMTARAAIAVRRKACQEWVEATDKNLRIAKYGGARRAVSTIIRKTVLKRGSTIYICGSIGLSVRPVMRSAP
jgi:hypothetical protein